MYVRIICNVYIEKLRSVEDSRADASLMKFCNQSEITGGIMDSEQSGGERRPPLPLPAPRWIRRDRELRFSKSPFEFRDRGVGCGCSRFNNAVTRRTGRRE